jgi:hypothetical protein
MAMNQVNCDQLHEEITIEGDLQAPKYRGWECTQRELFIIIIRATKNIISLAGMP